MLGRGVYLHLEGACLSDPAVERSLAYSLERKKGPKRRERATKSSALMQKVAQALSARCELDRSNSLYDIKKIEALLAYVQSGEKNCKTAVSSRSKKLRL